MLVLLAFSFIGGVVTILSPCILPILPIILSTTTIGGKKRPLGIVTGFVLSFTFFTLFLSTIVNLTGIPATSLRFISIFIIAAFGLTLVLPQAQKLIERGFYFFQRFAPKGQSKNTGFTGGILIGMSLGLLWTPCVGPILASVISLAITGEVTGSAFFITFAYSLGTAIPMFAIIAGGQNALKRVPWLLRNTTKIQKAFGVIMILTAIAIYFNIDRQFQSYVLDKFPQYGTGLTSLEDNRAVEDALQGLSGDQTNDSNLEDYPNAPEVIPDGEWFNSKPFTLEDQRGKVVLVDFWTYTCINCIRTFPYLRDWWDKYEDDGLIILGVHSPEFEFEKSPDNLQKAINDFEIKYPVVQDNNFATWRAYKNRYWPAKYLIDKDGRIRYTHFGEGEYDKTEEMIQVLLREAGSEVNEQISNAIYDNQSRTPETYLGYSRMSSQFISPEGPTHDVQTAYTYPNNLGTNRWALKGSWIITEEYSESAGNSELSINFTSKDVFLVMNSDSEAQVEVYLDNELVDTITVSENRLYDILRLDNPSTHTLRLVVGEGVKIFAFTFG
jgi:cytochrome c biogenesis protein CcdA/thiol-disulfide isomerase/thioredoxin